MSRYPQELCQSCQRVIDEGEPRMILNEGKKKVIYCEDCGLVIFEEIIGISDKNKKASRKNKELVA